MIEMVKLTIALLLNFSVFLIPEPAFAYLDPGTGSYIFQVLVATLIGGLFTIKMYWQKIKDFFGGLFSKKQEK